MIIENLNCAEVEHLKEVIERMRETSPQITYYAETGEKYFSKEILEELKKLNAFFSIQNKLLNFQIDKEIEKLQK